jgi:DNA-directed RNA polymerase subunit RPC12/RpoP
MIRFECAYCAKHLFASNQDVGKAFHCSHCKGALIVPQASASDNASNELAEGLSAFDCPICHAQLSAKYPDDGQIEMYICSRCNGGFRLATPKERHGYTLTFSVDELGNQLKFESSNEKTSPDWIRCLLAMDIAKMLGIMKLPPHLEDVILAMIHVNSPGSGRVFETFASLRRLCCGYFDFDGAFDVVVNLEKLVPNASRKSKRRIKKRMAEIIESMGWQIAEDDEGN